MNHSPPGVLRALALSLLLLPGVSGAEEERWQLAMNQAELRDIVEEMSSILGTTVILDPKVQGRVTVMSRQALDREGVRRLFYSVLDAHNFTVIDQGDRILITPATEAKTRASQGDAKAPGDGQFVTEVIALGASTAADLAGLVRPLVSANGYVGPSVSANALVVTDTASNVRRIGQVVRQLDSGARNAHSLVTLRHGLAGEIAKVLEASLGKSGAEAGSLVIADPRANRLVVVGPADARRRLVQLAQSLDVPATGTLDNARVIRLRHSDAKQLAEVLDAMGQSFKAQGAGGHAKDAAPATAVTVKADERQNALVIFAAPAQLRTLENIVRELDQPRAQVLIHAAIVEITGDIVQALGVQWGLDSGNATGLINFPGTGVPVLGGLNFDDKNPAPEGSFLRLGNGSFSALISALASNSHSNLLSTPSLLTLDNQEAEIIVGQNVPFKTGSYATNSNGADNPFTTVERKDVGISLKVRPYINEGSLLRLDVEQEISDIAPSVSGIDSSDLITNKRALKSTILANDGEIIVIGGLIKDSVRSQESGVPGLRSIPYLGALFRWTKDTQTKSNLMVFLRPTIVRSRQDIAQISADRYQALRDLSQPNERQDRALALPDDPQQMFDGRAP
ncbi:general secretion pathway protein D [Pseudomonas sp. ok272]|uniref:type II secretion system secretin GspD n=1 Tax=unclassified Pseudomonas TaxID=196821 RepID=UPI0008B0750B|nr:MULTISPECIES: type II secretion system secretin GspD [unclassified Pseudomonas]SEN34088.1 general secretion pathway protein D [Pseudomonas sp. ok272]SFM84651.1 general secretion pathway protein D [Pseudomonas sp. ok602]